MVQLYLNGQLCDLYGKETIATDYSIAPISDITSRTTAKSINFKLPLTVNNRVIIENAHVIVNATTLPYKLIPAKLIANGLDQRIEYAQIKSIKEDIEISMYGSNIDFFSIIKSKKLSDLGDQWNHRWSMGSAHESHLNTNGYIYALIDYHADTPPTNYINDSTAEIDVRGLLPSVYLHSVIEKILSDSGFTAQGNFLNDADYKSVILPSAKLVYKNPIEFTDTFTFVAGDWLGLDHVIPLIIAANTGGWKLLKDSSVTITNQTNSTQYMKLAVTADFVATTGQFLAYDLLQVLEQNGLYHYNGSSSTGDPDIVYPLVEGDTYTITMNLKFQFTNESGAASIKYGFLYNTIWNYPYPYQILGDFILGYTFDCYLDIPAMLPNMKQSDLLKDTAQKFGLIFQVNNATKTVHIRRFSEIFDNIPQALDWSTKVDYIEKPDLQFDTDYAQRNLCVYSDDDTVVKPAGTDSEILIKNDHLDAEKEFFKSPFAASEQVRRFGGSSIAQMKMFTLIATPEQEIAELQPRYLVKRMKLFSPKFKWKYTEGHIVETDLAPLTHFILPGQSFNAGFENNLLDNSAELIEMIQNYKTVSLMLRLTVKDINQLDFFTPVWIELNGQPGCYYYISKIKQFKVTSKESTEVELVKLPS